MTQPTLQLNTNKNLASVKNITIRDSGNKEVLEAYLLNHEGQPYNLENKTVTFMENKDGDKFVSDPNVQIVNATAGFVRYTLQSQVHSASGIAWFEINDNSGLVDSTGNFNIRVENGLRATADNTTYIADLEKLKQQMETLLKQADGELQAELQKAEQQLDQELQNFRNQYNSLSADFQNQFKAAQNARQQDYTNQKNAINQDWTNNKNQIWSKYLIHNRRPRRNGT
ncbi:BppU family phage baseplate upper protein [Lactobacillus gasseri]|uniref:BppU family phage baseplate upper protein n=1 Tax=Lactobacillus gasseri TaxID=1596 RepID=UPI0009BEB510|nr:BppU family phage baseplate upper protein [Lactobacillus gasseri]